MSRLTPREDFEYRTMLESARSEAISEESLDRVWQRVRSSPPPDPTRGGPEDGGFDLPPASSGGTTSMLLHALAATTIGLGSVAAAGNGALPTWLGAEPTAVAAPAIESSAIEATALPESPDWPRTPAFPREAASASSDSRESPAEAAKSRSRRPASASMRAGASTSRERAVSAASAKVDLEESAGTPADLDVADASRVVPGARSPSASTRETGDRASRDTPARSDESVKDSNTPATKLLADQLRRVERARELLRAGRLRAALRAIARSRRRFPEGQFTPDLQLLEVRALCGLGRHRDARRLAGHSASLSNRPALQAEIERLHCR